MQFTYLYKYFTRVRMLKNSHITKDVNAMV